MYDSFNLTNKGIEPIPKRIEPHFVHSTRSSDIDQLTKRTKVNDLIF